MVTGLAQYLVIHHGHLIGTDHKGTRELRGPGPGLGLGQPLHHHLGCFAGQL